MPELLFVAMGWASGGVEFGGTRLTVTWRAVALVGCSTRWLVTMAATATAAVEEVLKRVATR
jgi:hypothetical protein